MENGVVNAIALGLISASSLPLGAIAGADWRPGERAMAFFLAFGGDALLAASAVEVVAKAVSEGQVLAMAVGAMVGGSVFKGLNALVNDRGGYLRKPSTAMTYWKGGARKRLAAVMRDLKRLELARRLPPERLEALLPHVLVREYPMGRTIYHAGDPAENLYIIEDGEVDLLDPQRGRQRFEHLTKHMAFGRLSFLIGSPRATEAVTVTDTRLLIVPRHAFFRLIEDAPDVREAIVEHLEDAEIRRFLEERLELAPEQAAAWSVTAAAQLRKSGTFDPPVRLGSR